MRLVIQVFSNCKTTQARCHLSHQIILRFQIKQQVRMVLDVGEVKKGVIARYENFLGTSNYKALAQSTQSFNRKLNEERKMRIPYVDGQTGVAMKHYNNVRVSRERMPGRRDGQVYSYPQRRWHKKRYQYLQYFMLPKHLRFAPGVNPEGGVPTSVSLKYFCCFC